MLEIKDKTRFGIVRKEKWTTVFDAKRDNNSKCISVDRLIVALKNTSSSK